MYAIAESQVDELLCFSDLTRGLYQLYSGKRRTVVAERSDCTIASPRIWMGLSGAICSDSGLAVAKTGLESDSPEGTQLLADSLIIASDGRRGKIIATIEAETLTAKRTAATTIAIAQILNRADAKTITVIGTGVQAKAHIDASDACLSLERIYLCGRTLERARAFVSKFAGRWRVPIVSTGELKTAIGASQIAIAATSSATPVLLGEYLHPGLHVAAIGAYEGGGWELDGGVIEKADLILADSPSGAIKSADFKPLRESKSTKKSLLQTPQDYCSTATEALSSSAITLWKSVGTAEQDLIATEILLKNITNGGNKA